MRATRTLDEVEIGASVRGSLALVKTARAWALLHGRAYVMPADVEQLFIPVLGHRLMLAPTYLAETRNLTMAQTLQQIQDECLEPRAAATPGLGSRERAGGWAQDAAAS